MINITDHINITDVVLIWHTDNDMLQQVLSSRYTSKKYQIECTSDHVGFGIKLGPTLVEADLGRTLEVSTFSAEDGNRLLVGPL